MQFQNGEQLIRIILVPPKSKLIKSLDRAVFDGCKDSLVGVLQWDEGVDKKDEALVRFVAPVIHLMLTTILLADESFIVAGSTQACKGVVEALYRSLLVLRGGWWFKFRKSNELLPSHCFVKAHTLRSFFLGNAWFVTRVCPVLD